MRIDVDIAHMLRLVDEAVVINDVLYILLVLVQSLLVNFTTSKVVSCIKSLFLLSRGLVSDSHSSKFTALLRPRL
jgi:hypothetical protein